MGPSGKAFLAALVIGVTALPLHAEESDPLLKAVAKDAGKMSPSEQKLFSSSIASTKESIARETLDVFYRDAIDFYHQGKYNEALELLDKIYSIEPYYEDVGTLRETITRLRDSHDIESKKSILQDFMRKGNSAQAAGHTVQAIGFWKQALTVNASYEPAKKKIQEAKHAMAQKQYEAGYLYYHHGDYDYALDSWSNAIALDPTYKQRGLLLLMSKVQILQQKDKIAKLAAQGSQQYASQDLTGALQTYQELLTLDERNEEARRMTARIKIQLGQAAYVSAQESLSKGLYAQAIKQWQDAITYEYEVQSSQKWIQEAEHRIQNDRDAKRNASKPKPAAAPAATEPAPPVVAQAPQCPPPSANAEAASGHYREGLTAIRSKDFHHALEELEMASRLNPCDEHIYVAKERARQEWNAASSNRM